MSSNVLSQLLVIYMYVLSDRVNAHVVMGLLPDACVR